MLPTRGQKEPLLELDVLLGCLLSEPQVVIICLESTVVLSAFLVLVGKPGGKYRRGQVVLVYLVYRLVGVEHSPSPTPPAEHIIAHEDVGSPVNARSHGCSHL